MQNSVRRLIIIFLSLLFLLIVRASIWIPFGKNLAEPCYDQKDDQFAKCCHTPLNPCFHWFFWRLSSNRHFATLNLKFLSKPITKETMNNLQNTLKRLGIIIFRKCFAADHQSDILELLMWNSHRTPLWPKIWQFAKHSLTGLLFTVFRWSICAYYVSNILESLLWNSYLTKLRLITWPVWKMLLHASESSFSATPMVLTIRTTLWSTYCEIFT